MFKEMLQDIVDNTQGATGALLMGYDGIALETYVADNVDTNIETVGMEYSVVLTQLIPHLENEGFSDSAAAAALTAMAAFGLASKLIFGRVSEVITARLSFVVTLVIQA